MLEEQLLKTNFIGRDGFRWWVGQIAQQKTQGIQVNGGGWGNRFKVRILGYHPYSEVDLPDEDLPWAQVLLSPTDGSGAANRSKSVRLSPVILSLDSSLMVIMHRYLLLLVYLVELLKYPPKILQVHLNHLLVILEELRMMVRPL